MSPRPQPRWWSEHDTRPMTPRPQLQPLVPPIDAWGRKRLDELIEEIEAEVSS